MTDDDPFAITERPIPLDPAISGVDLRAAWTDKVVRYGRLESEKEQDGKAAAEALRRFAFDLLPTADALERVRNAAGSGSDNGPGGAVAGLEKMFKRTLERHGVERVSLLGQVADPDLVDIHEERPDRSKADGTVLDELVVAYRWRGEVLRRGRVVTSAGTGPDAD